MRKRENLREEFDGLNFNRIEKYEERDVERIMEEKGIVRNRGKIV